MNEFDWEMVEKQRMPFEDRALFAIAQVQGSWNQKSKDLLARQFDLKSLGAEGESVKFEEKVLLTVAKKAASELIGDSSKAHFILGHPIALPEAQRGIIVLLNFVGGRNIENLSDWQNAALIAQELSEGKNLKEILESFKGRSEKLGVIGNVLKHFDVDRKKRTKDFIQYLEDLSGGSESALLENKNKLQTEVVESLKLELRKLPLFKLISISKVLNVEHKSEDETINTSISSAKELFIKLFRTEANEFASIFK